ncbi:MAG: TIGR03088 family PEP-CTERM/XrtA system glycosyltransferase [Gammaproteobacteria bacterium]
MSGRADAMRPLTVMHVLYRFSIGGLENGLVNLVNRLDAQRYRHCIVCLSDFDPAFVQRLTGDNFEVHALAKRPGNDPRVWWRTWRLLRRVRPDVLHTRNFVALELQLLGLLAGVPRRIHGEHGWDVQDPAGEVRKYQLARRVLGLCVQRFVALSRDLEDYLLTRVGLAPAKVERIVNGVDSERFLPAERAPGPTLVIGTVGRMKAIKNQTLLCRAFIALCARRADLRERLVLRLVGSGPLRADCEALLDAAGLAVRAQFVGDSDAVAEEMRGMDVFVLPSLAEGISNTILEAMSSGLPVVATRVGGNAELVSDGESGVLIASEDEAALAAALERYADDDALRRRHGARGRELVEARFSLARMVERYDALYRAPCAAAATLTTLNERPRARD